MSTKNPAWTAFDRSVLLAGKRRQLARGRWSKAEVWLAELPDGQLVVVKEFVNRQPLAKIWAGIQIRRERGLVAALAGRACAPRMLGELSREHRHEPRGLVFEFVSGQPLWRVLHPRRRRAKLAELESLIDSLASEGIYHLDLRGRENVLLAQSGQIVILDWAGAVHLRGWSRRFSRLFEPVHELAKVKWEQLLDRSGSAAATRPRRSARIWRALWPVNRKGVGRDLGLES